MSLVLAPDEPAAPPLEASAEDPRRTAALQALAVVLLADAFCLGAHALLLQTFTNVLGVGAKMFLALELLRGKRGGVLTFVRFGAWVSLLITPALLLALDDLATAMSCASSGSAGLYLAYRSPSDRAVIVAQTIGIATPLAITGHWLQQAGIL